MNRTAAALACLLAAIAVGPTSGQDAPVIEKMLAAWKAKRAATKLIQYHFVGTATMHKHEARGASREAQPTDIVLKQDIILDLDLTDGSYRNEQTYDVIESKTKEIQARHGIGVFDGKTYKTLSPNRTLISPAYSSRIRGIFEPFGWTTTFRWCSPIVGCPASSRTWNFFTSATSLTTQARLLTP